LENCLLVDWFLTCSYGTIAPKYEMDVCLLMGSVALALDV
jgi:hypothetical protein